MCPPELPIPNLFLASLPEDDSEALRPHFEIVRLPLRQIVHEMGAPIEHCYFSDGGMTSLLVGLEDGAMIEAGVVGKEGFAGAAALMGFEDLAPHTSMIQIPGVALRIAPGVLRAEMLRRPALLDRVHRFTQVLNIQISHTAACNAHHNLQERLARWLLMAHDRADPMRAADPGIRLDDARRAPSRRHRGGALAAGYRRHQLRARPHRRPRPAAPGGSLVRMLRHRSGHYRRVLGWPAVRQRMSENSHRE